jgi:hypothetical protein
MVALQKEESTAKSDSAQCRGSSLLLVPLRPNLAVQCKLLEDLASANPFETGYRSRVSDGGAFDFGIPLFSGSQGGTPVDKPIVSGSAPRDPAAGVTAG